MLRAAAERIGEELGEVERIARTIQTMPVGPSRRRYANTALLLRTPLVPLALLAALKQIERAFGRRGHGRWGARVLDCDIILWSGGALVQPGLSIPHPLFRERQFVLAPAARIAPDWRDPITGLTVRRLHARLTGNRPLPR